MHIFKILIELLKGSTSSAFWLWTVWYTALWKQKPVQILEVEKLALSWATPANKPHFSAPLKHMQECSLAVATLPHPVWVHPLHSSGWITQQGAGGLHPDGSTSEQCQGWDSQLAPRESPVCTALISLMPNLHLDATFKHLGWEELLKHMHELVN